MKLTITKKPFKGNAVGSEIDMNDKRARLLVKLGRAEYQTRMLTAEAPQVQRLVQPDTPARVEPQEAPPFEPDLPVLAEEVDSSGATWDEKVHVSTRLKNADGTWRKRRGAASAEATEEE